MSGRRGEFVLDPRVIANQEKILKYLRALQDDQHRLKQDVHMIMKENKHFQKDIYENFKLLSKDVYTLQETVDDVASCADSIKNKTKSVYKHVRTMNSQQNASNSDTDSYMRRQKRPSRQIARTNIRHSDGLLHPEGNHMESPDSDTDFNQPLTVNLPNKNRMGSYGSDPNLLKPHSSTTTKGTELKEKFTPFEDPPTQNDRGAGQSTIYTRTQQEVTSPVQLQDQPPDNIPKPDTRRVRQHQNNKGKRNQNEPLEHLSISGIKQVELPGPVIVKSNMSQKECGNLARHFGLDPRQGSLTSIERATQSRGAHRYQVGFHSVFIVDTSCSMKGNVGMMNNILQGILECLDGSAGKFALEEFVSFIIFGKETTIFQPFSNNYMNLMGIMKECLEGEGNIKGRSPLLQALATALCYIECHGDAVKLYDHLILPRIVIVSDFHVTDEKVLDDDDDDVDEATNEEIAKVQQGIYGLLKILKQRNYPVFCVPVGNYNRTVCKNIRESEYGNVLKPDKIAEIGNNYRHQVVAINCLHQCDISQNKGVEENIDDLVEMMLSKAELPLQDQETVVDIITRILTIEANRRVGNTDVLRQDDIENDADIDDARGYVVDLGATGGDDLRQPEMSTYQQQNRSPTPSMSARQDRNSVVMNATGDTLLDLPEWRVPKGTTNLSLQEIGRLPVLGSRVERGKDWKWESQDGRGPGTVIGHKSEGIIFVLWDNNSQLGIYRFGNFYDVEVVKSPRKVDQGQIEVGCWVVRGRDWSKGDEDGGEGTMGVVIRKIHDRRVQVRWPSRVIDEYKFGAEDQWEVQVTYEEPMRAEATRVQTPDVPVSVADERPAIPGEEETQPVWRWQDFSYQWRIMSPEAIAKLEQTYSKTPQGNVMISHKGKNAKVFLQFMECEINGQKRPIQREIMSRTEVQSLQIVEEMMAD